MPKTNEWTEEERIARQAQRNFEEIVRIGLTSDRETFDRHIKLNYPHLYYLRLLS